MLRALSLCTCCRQYPGAATGRRLRSSHPAVSAFPEIAVGSACTSTFSRLARRSLALRPAHSRRHLYVTRYTEGFSHFVTSMTAPVASGWSVRRVGLAPTGKRRLLTAHAKSGRSPTAWRMDQFNAKDGLGHLFVTAFLRINCAGKCRGCRSMHMEVAKALPWSSAWLLGLPLLVFTIVAHVCAIMVFAKIHGRHRVPATRDAVRFVLFVALLALAAAALLALEAATWAGLYLWLGAMPDGRAAMLYSLGAITSYGHAEIFLDDRWRIPRCGRGGQWHDTLWPDDCFSFRCHSTGLATANELSEGLLNRHRPALCAAEHLGGPLALVSVPFMN